MARSEKLSLEMEQRRTAFDDLRDFEEEVFGPFCGFCGEPESNCERNAAGVCVIEADSLNDPATIHCQATR